MNLMEVKRRTVSAISTLVVAMMCLTIINIVRADRSKNIRYNSREEITIGNCI